MLKGSSRVERRTRTSIEREPGVHRVCAAEDPKRRDTSAYRLAKLSLIFTGPSESVRSFYVYHQPLAQIFRWKGAFAVFGV